MIRSPTVKNGCRNGTPHRRWAPITYDAKFAYLSFVPIDINMLVSKKIKNNRIIIQANTTQHTTHKTQHTKHTTTNMIRRRPTLQQLCPLSPWVGQRWPQIMVTWFPMCPFQACGVRIPFAAVCSFVWANKFNPSNNRVMGGGMALCGYRLMI